MLYLSCFGLFASSAEPTAAPTPLQTCPYACIAPSTRLRQRQLVTDDSAVITQASSERRKLSTLGGFDTFCGGNKFGSSSSPFSVFHLKQQVITAYDKPDGAELVLDGDNVININFRVAKLRARRAGSASAYWQDWMLAGKDSNHLLQDAFNDDRDVILYDQGEHYNLREVQHWTQRSLNARLD
jgi:hypothetical protein